MVDETIYKRDKKAKESDKEGSKIIYKNKDFSVKNIVTIGRDPSNDIVIENDPLVSRKHAIIEREGENLYITDKGSTNGTYINKNPIQKNKKQLLKKGDVILIGKTELKVTG